MADHTAPDVTVCVLVEPDGEIKFGPTKMRSVGAGQWAIPGLTWIPDQALTVLGVDAIVVYNGETKRIELPVELAGQVTPGRAVRIDLKGAVFNMASGTVH